MQMLSLSAQMFDFVEHEQPRRSHAKAPSALSSPQPTAAPKKSAKTRDTVKPESFFFRHTDDVPRVQKLMLPTTYCCVLT